VGEAKKKIGVGRRKLGGGKSLRTLKEACSISGGPDLGKKVLCKQSPDECSLWVS